MSRFECDGCKAVERRTRFVGISDEGAVFYLLVELAIYDVRDDPSAPNAAGGLVTIMQW